jgi:hypothetical protein
MQIKWTEENKKENQEDGMEDFYIKNPISNSYSNLNNAEALISKNSEALIMSLPIIRVGKDARVEPVHKKWNPF